MVHPYGGLDTIVSVATFLWRLQSRSQLLIFFNYKNWRGFLTSLCLPPISGRIFSGTQSVTITTQFLATRYGPMPTFWSLKNYVYNLKGHPHERSWPGFPSSFSLVGMWALGSENENLESRKVNQWHRRWSYQLLPPTQKFMWERNIFNLCQGTKFIGLFVNLAKLFS